MLSRNRPQRAQGCSDPHLKFGPLCHLNPGLAAALTACIHHHEVSRGQVSCDTQECQASRPLPKSHQALCKRPGQGPTQDGYRINTCGPRSTWDGAAFLQTSLAEHPHC